MPRAAHNIMNGFAYFVGKTFVVTATAVLSSNVLVLNRHYMALRVVDVKRAFSLLYRRVAEVISVEDDEYQSYDFESWRQLSELKAAFARESHDWIRTVRFEIAVPRIIRLLGYDRLPRQEVKLNRRNIFARDRNRCQYCGRSFPTSELSIDHVVPRSQGGQPIWTNLVSACVECNVKKGGRTPQQAHLKLIAPPVKPRRNPVVVISLSNKYASWKHFLDHAYWDVELR